MQKVNFFPVAQREKLVACGTQILPVFTAQLCWRSLFQNCLSVCLHSRYISNISGKWIKWIKTYSLSNTSELFKQITFLYSLVCLCVCFVCIIVAVMQETSPDQMSQRNRNPQTSSQNYTSKCKLSLTGD